jgi:polysaccharide export outer membrane protein
MIPLLKAAIASFVYLSLILVGLFCIQPASLAGDASIQAFTQGAQISADKKEISYRIGPQNMIQIKIFGDASTNTIYRVDELGYIKHALVGRVRLGNHTVSEAEDIMEERLAGDYIINPQVTILVLEHSRFSVIGEVKKPGTYELTGHVTVIEAISMAGGFSPVASQGSVKIMRKRNGTQSAIDVNTTRITQQGDLTADVAIEADDVVVVPKSFF